jgi:hypothetical protein
LIKGTVDFTNIMAVVLESKDNDYKLGTKNGVISRLFSRSEITVLDKRSFWHK